MVIFMNNEIILIIFRTICVLIILFIMTKLMGKKQLSQMNIYDYLIGITIGNIGAEISLNLERSFISGIISLIIYCSFSIVVTYFSLRNLKFRKLFCGNPTVLIDKGNILIENLKKEGIDINSFEEEARLNGYFDLRKINYAILETNGQISFLPKEKENYVTNANMNIKVEENELGINLIQDGKVMTDNINYIRKDIKWLDKVLKKNGYKDYTEIFLMIYKNDKDIKFYSNQK